MADVDSKLHRLAGVDKLSGAYFKLLSSIDWDDPVLVAGLREGLNKFLSNAHLASFRGPNKYHKTHLVTPEALQQLEHKEHRGLVWEHLVPKGKYIQEPCEQHARDGTLTLEFVRDQLRRYWYLATITSEQDKQLMRIRMPEAWGENVRARYDANGLVLMPNPFFEGLRK